ncbi:hypothetical protein LTR97_007094 [Elasticomyces elasticus]|uniref:Uncharacterized protein n=1 Tax=Elasticomyces elasticus TaxID=574655 RepID=A0AAN7ZTN1_9PEZI|nr:hypothetical protein LTR97_007094 [Elasticomyces elasticus]
MAIAADIQSESFQTILSKAPPLDTICALALLMPSRNLLIGLIPLLLAPHTQAQCQQNNGLTDQAARIETDTSLCIPRTDSNGWWTFSMDVFLTCSPNPGGGAEASLTSCDGSGSGQAPPATFSIYDDTCLVRGVYDAPSCGIPFIIEENYQPWVLTVVTAAMTVGGPYFKFTYGDGTYETGVNDCYCSNVSSGLTARDNCLCPFPVSGSQFTPLQTSEAEGGVVQPPTGTLPTSEAEGGVVNRSAKQKARSVRFGRRSEDALA